MIAKILISCVFLLTTASHALTAKSWLVADGDGNTLQSDNVQESRSIASITKLMTVMVVLDKQQDLNERVGVYSRRELIKLALIKSDNQAATRLCEYYIGGRDECVKDMNRKAQNLGMWSTKFVDATGLNIMNISTASDLVKMVIESSNYPVINEASNTKQAKIQNKKKWFVFNNTNPIVDKYNFLVSKTGYIRASGGCIVMMLDTDIGRRIVVLLGSKDTRTRIPEAESIARLF
jgi:serine-type D-Ala-D-Ala endopeptidase (penicillin-binding protein 7)